MAIKRKKVSKTNNKKTVSHVKRDNRSSGEKSIFENVFSVELISAFSRETDQTVDYATVKGVSQ